MAQQFSDAARSELTAGILAGDTTFTLVDGSRFPEANAGTSPVGDGNLWFKAVLQDETGFEIVYVRTHAVATTPDTLSNVLRGQEGTTARSFAATSVVGLRLTALDMANLWTTMANKATDSVALTDAAGTATLPATAAASVASRLQVLRNNVKQAFADLSNKLNTDFTSLTTRTIDGTETLAFSGGLKATVAALKTWLFAQSVGTVSQSSGVPTGAIIESGVSNDVPGDVSGAHGYVRFADGTQICWASVVIVTPTYTAAGSVYVSPQYTWTYPVAFSASTPPALTAMMQDAAADAWTGGGSSPSVYTSFGYRVFRAKNTAGPIRISLQAIGRWY